MRVIGISARVSNDNQQDMMALWSKFHTLDVKTALGAHASDDLITVYTDYEGDYTAPYTMVIGYEVSDDAPCPEGLSETRFEDDHEVYTVTGPLPEAVVAQWQAIWANTEKPRAYIADYDRYKPDGSVDIHVQYT